MHTDTKPETRIIEAEESLVAKPPKRIIDECIVAYKVYDSCRRQSCLTYRELSIPLTIDVPAGPSAADNPDDTTLKHEIPVIVPHDAASITISNLTVGKISIGNKKLNPFRAGHWDIDVKYDFHYTLSFYNAAGEFISDEKAKSAYKAKTTLFGSLDSELVISTDLPFGNRETFAADPFVWVEAKAVDLDAKLFFPPTRQDGEHPAPEIQLTIGLFVILKLFRLVHLNVQSTGFCTPSECKESHDINPCEYFAGLDFPMEMFTPPQKPEFNFGRR